MTERRTDAGAQSTHAGDTWGIEQARAFTTAAPWRFASTMPERPHWYTVRGQAPEREFEAFVTYIRAGGYDAEFEGTTYTYRDIDGYAYWTMGAPLAETVIINRRPIVKR
jgi:hypothetical protein